MKANVKIVLLLLVWVGYVVSSVVMAETMKSEGPQITMAARLVDREKKAAQRSATIEIDVRGMEIIDPALAKEMPKKGQGHLHYQVDMGPIIATTVKKLSFHELSPGQHTIMVMLAGNDHKPLGPKQTFTVNIKK